jgi:HPt (histidine-containing phosphotransfer) domain-containing protein
MPALQQAAHALQQACRRPAPEAEVEALLERVRDQLDPVLGGLQALETPDGPSA